MEMLGRVVKGFLVAGMVVTLGILRLSFAFLRVQQQFSAFSASRIPAGNDAARLLQRYAHPGKLPVGGSVLALPDDESVGQRLPRQTGRCP